MPKKQDLLAVLIDADNIPSKHAGAILKEITRFGEPALRRVYGDWNSDQLKSWRKEVRELGLVARQETANTKGKNASDIGLVIDAMDILYTRRYDGFVIVSSDSDFTALANRLREDGAEVIGIGEEKAPSSFRSVCNRFVLIENILASEDDERATAVSPADKESAKPVNVPQTKAVPLILKAMKDIDPDIEWYGLGQIGQQVSRATPDFDPRTYGSAKLSALIRKLGEFDLRETDGRWEVRRKRRD